MNHVQLIEVLRVYGVVVGKPMLVKLLSEEITIEQYLKHCLKIDIGNLPRYEADVLEEEKKLRDTTNEDLTHRTNMLRRSKEYLQAQRHKIRDVRKELQKFSTVNSEVEN